MGVTLAYARVEEEPVARGRMGAGGAGMAVVAGAILANVLFLVLNQLGVLTDWGDVWAPVRWVTGGVCCVGCALMVFFLRSRRVPMWLWVTALVWLNAGAWVAWPSPWYEDLVFSYLYSKPWTMLWVWAFYAVVITLPLMLSVGLAAVWLGRTAWWVVWGGAVELAAGGFYFLALAMYMEEVFRTPSASPGVSMRGQVFGAATWVMMGAEGLWGVLLLVVAAALVFKAWRVR